MVWLGQHFRIFLITKPLLERFANRIERPLGRSTRLQTSLAYNPTFAAIMFSKHAVLFAHCLGLGMLMGLTACQPAGSMPSSPMNNSSSASDTHATTNINKASASGKSDKSAQQELYRLNPAPQEGYEVTLKIENAPGPFKQIRWSALYQAKGCNYVVNEWAGVRGEPEKVLELPFKEQADGSYVATVYLDAMLDEDYYGNGVCKWKLTSMGPIALATGNPKENSFTADLNAGEIQSEQALKFHYLNSYYPGGSSRSLSLSGQRDVNVFAPEVREQHFSMALESKRVQR